MNEKKLIRQCKKGKSSAQHEVYRVYAPRLRGVCRRYIVDPDEAEDVMQEGFIRIFSQIEKFTWQGDHTFFYWMKRVMINHALNYLKKNRAHFHGEALSEEHADRSGDDNDRFFDDNYSRFSKEDVVNALTEVPLPFKMVLNMAVIDGMKHKEIAEALEIAEETSRSRLTRAKQLLKKALLCRAGTVVRNA
ncbi:sigma-70 family RNA polymerase sigma factor [Marinilabilia sp.]|uniref:RNA polymerase sigma factor n=1 Tax=Marinilabilia sp. TaxID=2021252 RepID=UPI0025BD6EF6|nr:sigma-70 family RNA polymerase sigma factor [Marinilabilia sp.]